MGEALINVYCVDIKTKEISPDFGASAVAVSLTEDEDGGYSTYDIDFSSLRVFYDNIGYGVIAVNNGTVFPLYSEGGDGQYSYNYKKQGNVYFGDEVMDSWLIYYSYDAVVSTGKILRREALLTEDNIEARLKFGDSPYATSAVVEETDDVQFTSISIEEGIISGSYLSYGDVYSPTCSVEMTKCEYAIPGVWFRVEFKIDGVWQCFGVFLINSIPTKTSEYISFAGVGMLEGVMSTQKPTLASYSLANIVNDIYSTTKIPVIIDFADEIKKVSLGPSSNAYYTLQLPGGVEVEENDDGTVSYPMIYYPYGDNYRDLLSCLSTALQSNVVERNGVIHIVHLKDMQLEKRNAAEFIFNESQYVDEPSDLGYYYYPYPIKVSCKQSKPHPQNSGYNYLFIYMGNENKEVTILDKKVTSDDFTVVSYPLTINADPLWTLVTNVSPEIWGTELQFCGFRNMVEALGFNDDYIVYKPLSIEFNGYHPCIYPGMKISLKNGEYVDNRALIGNVTITYDGGISMSVSTPCDVNFDENSTVAGSSEGVSSSTGIAQFTSFVMSVQDASIINDGVITGSKIANSTITNSKIADGTITGSLIADSTLTGAKIKDAEIGFEKVNSSFINNLTATDAYLSRLKASVADIDNLTADDAIIKNIQSVAISADYIRTATADIGYLVADEADLKYADITFANIDTANINKANIGLLLAEIGLLDRATIVEGHVTGFLDSVEVNASSITAGTLIADRILLRGSEEGLLFALNNMGELVSENIDSLDGYVLADRTVNADKLVAHSITANEIDVENLFAQDILATGTITGATLKGAYAEIEDGKVGAFSILTDQLTAGISSGVYHYVTSFNAGNTGNPSGTGITVFSYNEETNEMLTYGYLNCNKMQWADNVNAVSFVADKDGVETEGKTRLAANKTQGGTLSDYSVQIGSISSNHLNMGARTIQAASASNAAASLYLNSYGGDVNIGKAGSNVYIAGSNMSRSVLYEDSTTLSGSGSTSAQTGTLTDDIKNYKRIKIYAKNNNGYLYSKELYNNGTDLTTTFNVSNLGWLQSTVVSIVANSLTVNLSVQRNVTSSVSSYSNTTRYLHVYRVEGYKS